MKKKAKMAQSNDIKQIMNLEHQSRAREERAEQRAAAQKLAEKKRKRPGKCATFEKLSLILSFVHR